MCVVPKVALLKDTVSSATCRAEETPREATSEQVALGSGVEFSLYQSNEIESRVCGSAAERRKNPVE